METSFQEAIGGRVSTATSQPIDIVIGLAVGYVARCTEESRHPVHGKPLGSTRNTTMMIS